MVTKSRSSKVSQLSALSTGIPELCAGHTFVLESVSYSATEAAALASDLLAAETEVAQTLASYHDAVRNCAAVHKKNDPLLKLLRTLLTSSFSNAPSKLETLGLPVPKTPSPLSIEANLGKAAKNRAMRVARGTKGKRQKAAIKGDVKGVVITPVTRKPQE
jgi:hypothetical protein